VNGRNLLVCADDLNILGRSMHTTKEKTEALLVASKEIGQDVNLRRLSTWSSLNPLAPELFFKFLHILYLKCE
jgi:hypothetical protein